MPVETTLDLLTSAQVSKMLRVSIATVARMGADGRLAVAQRLPGPRGAFLFDRAAVEAYIAAQDAKWSDAAPEAATA